MNMNKSYLSSVQKYTNNQCFSYHVFLCWNHVAHDNTKKNIFKSDQSFVFISITTLSVDALFNKLLRCLILILRFREISKPEDWHSSTIALQCDRQINSATADRPVQFQSDWIIININITTSIVQETCGQLSPNRYRSAGRSGKMAPGPIPADPPRTPASVPPPPRRNGNTQHENTVTQKSAPHCGDRSATAPRKWKRTLTPLMYRDTLANISACVITVTS